VAANEGKPVRLQRRLEVLHGDRLEPCSFGSFGVPNGHQEGAAEAFPAAIGYALRNWVALTRYVEDGQLKIDTNGAEQALRPIVLLAQLLGAAIGSNDSGASGWWG
jgi:hypothetical protein